MTRLRPWQVALVLLLAVYGVYATAFIQRASFEVDGTRYFTLFDDAMISMQYARNLAAGAGPVWNAGQPAVEGYSNPLWMLYMALWHLLPISTAKAALPIQLSGVALCMAAVVLAGRVAYRLGGEDGRAAIAAAVLTAGYLPFTFWALRGMETALIAVLVLVMVNEMIEGARDGAGPRLRFYLALVAGVLTRMDFAVPAAALLIYLALFRPVDWRRTAMRAGAALVAALATLFVVRYAIFGEWLPNTYHLKLSGIPWAPRVQRGALMALAFLRGMIWFPFVLGLIYPLVSRSRSRIGWLLAGSVLSTLLYSAHVGGDAWEWWGHAANRFIVVTMPLLAVLIALSLTTLLDRLGERMQFSGRRFGAILLTPLVLATLLGLLGGPRGQLFSDLVRLDGPHVADDEAQVRLGLKLAEITEPDATIAVAWAGAVPYYSRRRAVDLLGKSDPVIARLIPQVSSHRDVEPGHNKFDAEYSIGVLRPDVVAHSYHREDDLLLAESYAEYAIVDPAIRGEYNPACFLRVGSPRVRWSQLSGASWLTPVARPTMNP